MNEKDFELLLESIKQAGAIKRRLELVRKQQAMAEQQLIESAHLYAAVYAEDQELQELTAAAIADWPEELLFIR